MKDPFEIGSPAQRPHPLFEVLAG